MVLDIFSGQSGLVHLQCFTPAYFFPKSNRVTVHSEDEFISFGQENQ